MQVAWSNIKLWTIQGTGRVRPGSSLHGGVGRWGCAMIKSTSPLWQIHQGLSWRMDQGCTSGIHPVDYPLHRGLACLQARLNRFRTNLPDLCRNISAQFLGPFRRLNFHSPWPFLKYPPFFLVQNVISDWQSGTGISYWHGKRSPRGRAGLNNMQGNLVSALYNTITLPRAPTGEDKWRRIANKIKETHNVLYQVLYGINYWSRKYNQL